MPIGLYNRGRGIFHKEATCGQDLGNSTFNWIKSDDLIFSGQFAWEGAVALAGDDEAGKIASHRYLYADQPECKAIFSRDILLDIVGRFVHLDSTDGKEAMIFPRFKQLDAVLTMIGHAKKGLFLMCSKIT